MSQAPQPVTVDNSPTVVSAGLAILAAIVAVGASSLVSVLSLIFGLLGLLGFAMGVVVGYRPAVSVGTAGIVVGLVAGAILGAPIELLIIGMIGLVFAWDVGQNAISMGTQIGRSSITTRAELAHAGTTFAVGAVAGLFSYGIYLLSPSGQPVTALVFALLAAVFFAQIMRM